MGIIKAETIGGFYTGCSFQNVRHLQRHKHGSRKCLCHCFTALSMTHWSWCGNTQTSMSSTMQWSSGISASMLVSLQTVDILNWTSVVNVIQLLLLMLTFVVT